MSNLSSSETISAYAARRDEIVESGVRELLALLGGADAFDVIDLMRQREIMAANMGYPEPTLEANPTMIEAVAVVLRARGERAVSSYDNNDSAAQRHSDRIRELAAEFLTLGTFHLLAHAQQDADELSTINAEYRGSVLNIRNKQYADIHDSMNEKLFDGESQASALTSELGFNYADFTCVRSAIEDEYLGGMFDVFDVVSQFLQAGPAGVTPTLSEENLEQVRSNFSDIIVTPGARAGFTAAEIAAETGMELEPVSRVLRRFSVDFTATDPVQAMLDFLDGVNPFADAGLLHDGAGNYIQLSVAIGTDHFRQVAEAALKKTKHWTAYNLHRKDVSEHLAIAHIAKALRTPPAFTELHYLAPKTGIAAAALHSAAEKPTSLGQDSEADALFIIDDVAICVEVKAQSFSKAAKRGYPDDFRRDLEKTVGHATFQAHRLEELITTNGGLWQPDRSWLDLSGIREVRSIAVFLDDLGPLGTGLDALVRGGVLTGDKFPWIVSMHDLATIAAVIDRAPEFLLYLRRRTDPATSRRFRAVDELDIFMLFMNGGLFTSPDPDAVFGIYPGSGRPTTRERRLYANEIRTAVRVDTHTNPLDTWMAMRDDPNVEGRKPTRTYDDAVSSVVDYLASGRRDGWLRFAADLLGIDSESQKALSEALAQASLNTRKDCRHHTAMSSYASEDGFPSFFAYSRAPGITTEDARVGLERFMTLKKHQLQSDRSLGLLLAEDGSYLESIYMNDLPGPDAELDEMVQRAGLQPLPGVAPIVPPSASRPTLRLKPKKRR
jgi:hypothetical protein